MYLAIAVSGIVLDSTVENTEVLGHRTSLHTPSSNTQHLYLHVFVGVEQTYHSQRSKARMRSNPSFS